MKSKLRLKLHTYVEKPVQGVYHYFQEGASNRRFRNSAKVYDFNKNGRTHKSLGINEVVDDAIANHVDTVAMISSGNYIRTLIGEIRQRGLENRIKVVNLSNETKGIEGCTEIEIPDMWILRDSPEREVFVRKEMPNCGNVRDYTDFSPKAYELKAEEILAKNPDYVSLGVGSGKLFLALRKVIQEKGLSTRLVGILPKGENGVFNNDNLYSRDENLYFREFNPQSLADKLVCPYTFYKPEILKAQAEGHVLIEVENPDFISANKKARKMELEAEISGSAGFVIMDPKIRKQYGISNDSSVVIVNTGRGYEWEEQVKKESRRRWTFGGLAAGLTGVSLLAGGLYYQSIPSTEELRYADLNGDGVVSAEEMFNCHMIVGTYDYNNDKDAERKYKDIKKHPWIDRKTLTGMKELKEKLWNEVIGRYHDNYKLMQRAFDGEIKFDDIRDLTFNQLQYLNERAQFDDLTAPEFYRCRLDRHMQLYKQGVKIPVWDVR